VEEGTLKTVLVCNIQYIPNLISDIWHDFDHRSNQLIILKYISLWLTSETVCIILFITVKYLIYY